MATASQQPIEAARADEAMEALVGALAAGPYTPVLQDCVVVARQGIRDNFTSSATPDNEDWPPRKIVGDGHPLLIDRGDLLQAATGGGAGAMLDVGSHEAMIGIDGGTIPYAAAQNYGYPERNLPSREYAGMREERVQECEELIADFVFTAFFGG